MGYYSYSVVPSLQARQETLELTKTRSNTGINPSRLSNTVDNTLQVTCQGYNIDQDSFSATVSYTDQAGKASIAYNKEKDNVVFGATETQGTATFKVYLQGSTITGSVRVEFDGKKGTAISEQPQPTPTEMFCAFTKALTNITFPNSITLTVGQEWLATATVNKGFEIDQNRKPHIKIYKVESGVKTAIIDADMNTTDDVTFTLPITINEYYSTIEGEISGRATRIPSPLPIQWYLTDLHGFSVIEQDTVEIKSKGKTTVRLLQDQGKKYVQEIPSLIAQAENPNPTGGLSGFLDLKEGIFTRQENGEWLLEWTNQLLTSNYTKAYITITGNATELTQVIVNNPFVNLFYMDSSTITSLLDIRFYQVDQTTGQVANESSYDLSNFIMQVYKPYVPIETTDKAAIKLGFYDTRKQAPLVKNILEVVESEKTLIKGKTNTSVDWNSRLDLFLPFKGFVSIEPSKILGKELQVRYSIESLTGNACIEILANGKAIGAYTAICKYETPIRTSEFDSVQLTNSIDNSNSYFNLECFLNLYWKDVLNEQAIPPITDCDLLIAIRDIRGYCEGELFNFHNISTAIRKEEKEMVVSLIQSGIIVKNETEKNP